MSTYGCNEQNPISGTMKKAHDEIKRSVAWWEVKKIVRLRLLSDPGFPMWDVSYCTGVMSDGEVVDVMLPFSQLPKRGYKRAIVNYAKKDGIFAKGIGVLDNISTLC